MESFGDSGDSLKLQAMNARFHISVVVLASLSIHIFLLMWIMHQIKVSLPESQRVVRYSHYRNPQQTSRPPQFVAGTTTPSINDTEQRSERKQEASSSPSSPAARGKQRFGLFRSQGPTAQLRAEQSNAEDLVRVAQLTQQRELQRTTIRTAISNLAVQLNPIVNVIIVCREQANTKIECTPAPSKKVRPLLERFFHLALEARQTGMADNPVHIDFGSSRGVSIRLLR